MRVQEFLVSFVLPVDEESPALSDEKFMDILNKSMMRYDPEPNISLSFSQVRDATPEEADDFAFEDEEEIFTDLGEED